MKFFSFSKDGGSESNVDGLFIVEIKSLFSIVLLRFNKGCRENFHSHAFDALTWFVCGDMVEECLDGKMNKYHRSLSPKITRKDKNHRVIANKTSYAISIRGKWDKEWFEWSGDKTKKITLTNGRNVSKVENVK